MIDLRVFVRGGVAVLLVLAQMFSMADVAARDIRWLRDDGQGNTDRELPRRQPEQWQRRQPPDGDAERRPEQQQRMSPEERRQLRRDIRDAGREVYPRR